MNGHHVCFHTLLPFDTKKYYFYTFFDLWNRFVFNYWVHDLSCLRFYKLSFNISRVWWKFMRSSLGSLGLKKKCFSRSRIEFNSITKYHENYLASMHCTLSKHPFVIYKVGFTFFQIKNAFLCKLKTKSEQMISKGYERLFCESFFSFLLRESIARAVLVFVAKMFMCSGERIV